VSRHLRHVAGTGPWRRIFNVVISRHVFRDHCDLVGWVFGEQPGCREAYDPRTVVCSLARASRTGPGELCLSPHDHDVVVR
jgi:hypothetical protein